MEFNEKTIGYILYAVGIIAGVRATDVRPGLSFTISIISLVVIIIRKLSISQEIIFFFNI